MGANVPGDRLIPVVCGLLLLAAGAGPARSAEATYCLDNGMEVILKESHGSPMVLSTIFVKSGSKHESRYEGGTSHFLEHVLFDGTTNMTRQELDASITNLGGYINGFTRQELTAYFVLLPSQYIEYGLTVQADMLFNSTFPEAEFEKERKVVIEEINGSLDFPGAPAEVFFTEKAYAGTGCSRPVLGYRPFIERVPREAVIAHWKKHYTPDNMVIVVIGDFDIEEMKESIQDVFGRIEISPPRRKPAPSDLHRKFAEGKHRSGFLTGQNRHDTVADVSSTHVNFSIVAPRFSDPGYLPFDFLSRYLAADETSPLMVSLQGGIHPLTTGADVSLVTKEEFTRLEISATTNEPDNVSIIIQTVLKELANLSNHEPDPDIIAGLKTSARCEAIYDAERLHHYGILIAPLIVGPGWAFIQSYPDLLDTVQWSHCQRAAQRWLSDPDCVVTVVRPVDSGGVSYLPEGIAPGEIEAYFDTAAFPDYDLSKGYELEYPDVDSIQFDLADRAVYHREVLDNGLTVIIKSSPDCRVFAANVLGKNRSANEPEGKAGITDFVNRCLEKGTTTLTAGQLANRLAGIGARLTLCDNPWIPYDDRYTTRMFSFIKFETIDRFAETGSEFLCELLVNPAFDTSEVENVRQEMLGILKRNAASPARVARDLFYETLFDNRLFGRPITGTRASITEITVDDLRDHHHRFYSPENMILSIVTGRDTAEVLSWVKQHLGDLVPARAAVANPEEQKPILVTGERHRELEKEQISIYAGGHLPGATDKDAVYLEIAASVLSARLYQNLREKQGLAYSTGAGVGFDRDFGWYYLSVSTAAENYQRALDGLILQTEKLAFDGPSTVELVNARNRMWGRLVRARLTSVNQAYYLGLNEFLGRGVGYDRELWECLTQAGVQSVRRVASRHFRTQAWVVATAGDRE